MGNSGNKGGLRHQASCPYCINYPTVGAADLHLIIIPYSSLFFLFCCYWNRIFSRLFAQNPATTYRY
jgi:hypothetical protein